MSAILELNTSSAERSVATTAGQFSSSEKRVVTHPDRNSRPVAMADVSVISHVNGGNSGCSKWKDREGYACTCY